MRAAATLLALVTCCAACGGSDSRAHQVYLWEQTCAPCHAIASGRPSPDLRAPNLADTRPTLEQVRRAVIDGRPGMPKGLLGDGDVDEVAAYVVARTSR